MIKIKFDLQVITMGPAPSIASSCIVPGGPSFNRPDVSSVSHCGAERCNGCLRPRQALPAPFVISLEQELYPQGWHSQLVEMARKIRMLIQVAFAKIVEVLATLAGRPRLALRARYYGQDAQSWVVDRPFLEKLQALSKDASGSERAQKVASLYCLWVKKTVEAFRASLNDSGRIKQVILDEKQRLASGQSHEGSYYKDIKRLGFAYTFTDPRLPQSGQNFHIKSGPGAHEQMTQVFNSIIAAGGEKWLPVLQGLCNQAIALASDGGCAGALAGIIKKGQPFFSSFSVQRVCDYAHKQVVVSCNERGSIQSIQATYHEDHHLVSESEGGQAIGVLPGSVQFHTTFTARFIIDRQGQEELVVEQGATYRHWSDK